MHYPAANTIITWEVWLRREAKRQPSTVVTLTNAAANLGYEVISNAVILFNRLVIIVRGTQEQLPKGVEVLGTIAEVRKAKTTAEFFSALTPSEQHEWGDELLERVASHPQVTGCRIA